MLAVVFSNLLEITLSVSAIILILLLLSRVLKKWFTVKWRYWVWLILALRLILPVNINLASPPVRVVPSEIEKTLAFGGAGDQSASCAATWEKGLILLGGDQSDDDLDPAAWSSADGSRWTRVAGGGVLGGPGLEFRSLTAWESGLVAVGSDNSGEDPDGAVWMSPPPGG